jgi:hypothetical protein
VSSATACPPTSRHRFAHADDDGETDQNQDHWRARCFTPAVANLKRVPDEEPGADERHYGGGIEATVC